MKMLHFLRFPGFYLRACTLSYDDGRDCDAKLIEIMRKHGLAGTFNLNSENLKLRSSNRLSSDEIISLFGDDTEIALHGHDHIPLARVNPDLAIRDIIADREYQEKTFGKIIRGMAYAFGSYSDEVIEMLRQSGVVYARITASTEKFDLPEDWLKWHPTCHHRNARLFELVDEFFAPPKSSSFWGKYPRLFYLWGHSYEFERDNNWDVIEKFGEEMAKHDNVWHATNMQIYDYVEAFKQLVFSSDISMVYNPTSTDIYLNVLNKDVLVKAGETVKL